MKNYSGPNTYDGGCVAETKKTRREDVVTKNDESPSDIEIDKSIEYHKGTLKRLSE